MVKAESIDAIPTIAVASKSSLNDNNSNLAFFKFSYALLDLKSSQCKKIFGDSYLTAYTKAEIKRS